MGGPETGTDGTNPVTGEPLEVNPETGEPYPIDPETGEAIKDLDGREKLTVEQGDQKFTMTEPNDDGEMGITVEDGAGELSEYRLDFSEEDAEGAEGEKAGESDFGPQGSEQGTSDKVYRPGPDGKIHIEDGNLKITAEQPKGPDGPTVVTVDNGEGEPVTYTLGDTDSPESLLDEEVTTQPAEADPAQDPRNFDRTQGGPDSAGGDGGGAPNGSPVSEESSASGDSAGGGAETGSNAAAAPAPAEGLESPGPSGETADSDSSSATHAAAVSDGGGGGSSSAGGGGGSDLGSSSDDTQPGGRTSSMSAGGGLATAPGGEGMAAQGGGASSAGAGGAGMMGGMGAMGGGGGGGQGGDQERSSSYRVDGDIFGAIAPETVRLSGSLADAPDVPVRFTR